MPALGKGSVYLQVYLCCTSSGLGAGQSPEKGRGDSTAGRAVPPPVRTQGGLQGRAGALCQRFLGRLPGGEESDWALKEGGEGGRACEMEVLAQAASGGDCTGAGMPAWKPALGAPLVAPAARLCVLAQPRVCTSSACLAFSGCMDGPALRLCGERR